MARKPVNDPYQAENQGLPHRTKLDSDPELEQAHSRIERSRLSAKR
jgi:hypothetical protein